AGLAVGAGLASERVRAVLDSGAYADQVRAEEAEAAALGINGVPYFVVDHTYGVSGAQRPGLLLAVLQRAWAAGRTTLVRVAAEGGRGEDGACRDGTCIVASGEEGLAASGGAQP
ncbi:MAG: DsbA family oxidoreductase, partial [Acidimicrobiales bacterium]